MKISRTLTDDAVLVELGERLTRRRIDMQLTQAAVAEQAGIAKRTLERMEAGHSSQVASLIRVLRVLDALPGLVNLLPATGPSPMDLLKQQRKPRQRASSKRGANTADSPWRWGDTE